MKATTIIPNPTWGKVLHELQEKGTIRIDTDSIETLKKLLDVIQLKYTMKEDGKNLTRFTLVKEKNGKFHKRQIVLLPTNGSSPLYKEDIGYLAYDEVLQSYGGVTHYHLYILSDETIGELELTDALKNGLYFESQNGLIKTITHNRVKGIGEYKRIIATTDIKLIEGIRFDKEFPYPSIPLDFIKLYITQYNDLNVINYVNVEYDEVYNSLGDEDIFDLVCTHHPKIDVLKTNENHEISINLIKDKWSKDELVKAFEDFACAVYDENYNKDTSIRERAEIMSKKWLDENL